MRTFISVAAFAAVALLVAVVSGCSSHKSHEPAPTSKAWMMQAGGHDVLSLEAPVDANCTLADGSVKVESKEGHVEFWMARNSRTVEEGVAHLKTQIASEFKGFTPTGTTELTVSGSPAKQVMGTGHEADDNDPGTAEAIVFKVGGRIFVALTHGETLRPSAQELMLKMVQTAKAP
jgi:hypothetical protein